MPRSPPDDTLLGQVALHTDGVTLSDLSAANPQISRRTLQRHLSRLVEAGRLRTTGHTSTRRYILTFPEPTEPPDSVRTPWLSPGGREVERLVRRPIAERTPVGYRRELLDAYRPGVDAWLSRSLRARLHALGRSPEGVRPAGTYARQILDRLLIDLSWASSHLEGNTYTRLDTENLIEFGRLAEGKDQREAQMIINHKAAIEMLVDDAENIGFNRYTLQNLHAILADGLLLDPGAGGRPRTIPVGISGTVYQPTAIPQLIQEAFDLILQKASAIDDPFEQAFFVMVHIPYLQPFEDVNKRVSRLAANIPLIRGNLAPLSFVDVAPRDYTSAVLGVYELRRIDLLRDLFAWAYERSCQRYTVLREAMPAPDPLRLRYRAELAEMVRQTVRMGQRIDPAALRDLGRELVEPEDLNAMVAMAMNELYRLHEGNIVRFGLRLSELRTWDREVRSKEPHGRR